MKNSFLYVLAVFFGIATWLYIVPSKAVRPPNIHMERHPESHVRIHNVPILPNFGEDFADIAPIPTDSQYHQLIQPYVRAPYGWMVEINDPALTWEVVQREYADILEPIYFEREDAPHADPVDIDLPYNVAAWTRTRFFNMTEDNFGMVWVENDGEPSHLLLFYQYDYQK